MKGIELSKRYYNQCFHEAFQKEFPEIYEKSAVGLVGSGSECYGFDDDISTDHDFEPGFCIFIPSTVSEKEEFNLQKAYVNLPKEFEGFKRNAFSPAGGSRNGVIRTSDFYNSKIGNPTGDLSLNEWFSIPESFLFEATNGEIFLDNLGEFSEIREKIQKMPLDVKLKKLAGNLLIMEQAGDYNFSRCLQRNETAAAQLALFEFTKYAVKTVFILNKKYEPYYKWSFKALRQLPKLNHLADSFEYLISTDNSEENAEIKLQVINDSVIDIMDSVKSEMGISYKGNDLEKLAYAVNDSIKDNDIRNKNILYAV